MSFVVDLVRQIDSRLDALQLAKQQPGDSFFITAAEAHDAVLATRFSNLQRLIKNLSTTASSKHALVSVRRITEILDESHLGSRWQPLLESSSGSESRYDEEPAQKADSSYEHELEWLLLSKATTQAYGAVLNTILEQALSLEDDIWYWEDIASTYRYATLYSIQTSPIRLWRWSKDVWADVRRRGGQMADGWGQFYGIVSEAVRERSLVDIQRRVVSPLSMAQNEAKRKAKALKRIRRRNANALGLLLGEGLSYETNFEDMHAGEGGADNRHKWKGTIAKNIALLDAVLHILHEGDTGKFDDAVAAVTEEDHYFAPHESWGEITTATSFLQPSDVAQRLRNVLTRALPRYIGTYRHNVKEHGRPSKLVRYWLPTAILVVSSGTIFRLVLNHKEDIITWIREFGQTVLDFWQNWVVEPTKKVIGTIRHDESSEVSILSKRSLEGDRESLERMVIDFAVAHPEGPALNASEIEVLRAKVREGDLTTVLKAYERDMQRPIMGAITGNLINALLIQVQKTKVDVEVAMSGIDSILKSQELLFGFIGLTPGVLVTVGVYRWLRDGLGNNSMPQWQKEGQLVLILRNIDRILVGATRHTNDYGEISYEDQGLLLFEVHRLRQAASVVLPRRIFHDFLEELNELAENRNGLDRQLKVVERMRWAYRKWFE